MLKRAPLILAPTPDDLRRQWFVPGPSKWRDEKDVRDYCERKRHEKRWKPKLAISFNSGGSAGSPDGNTFTSAGIDCSGNFIAVAKAWFVNAGEPTLTDSNYNSWQAGLTVYQDPGAVVRVHILYAYNATCSAGQTFTVTGNGAYAAIAVASYSGVLLTDPYDTGKENGDGATGTSVATGLSGTPSENNCTLITALGFNDATPTVDAAFIRRAFKDAVGGACFGAAIADNIQTTATSRSATWNWPGSSYGAASVAAFKAAAAGGGGTKSFMMNGIGKDLALPLGGLEWLRRRKNRIHDEEAA